MVRTILQHCVHVRTTKYTTSARPRRGVSRSFSLKPWPAPPARRCARKLCDDAGVKYNSEVDGVSELLSYLMDIFEARAMAGQ